MNKKTKDLKKVCTCIISCLTAFIAQAQQPLIASFSPNYGPVGQHVTISGANFSSNLANNTVFFGGAKAAIVSASSNTIVVKVPAGATFQPISVTVNRYTAWSKTPFTITFPNGSLSAGTFVRKINSFVNFDGNPHNTLLVDLDLDGKTDVLETNPGINAVSVYRNTTINGVISFATRINFNTVNFAGNHPNSINYADFDGDGLLDIVVSCEWSNSINVFRNLSIPGNIAFASPIFYNTGSYPNHVAVGDLDNDGKADLVVANESGRSLSLYKNTSTNTGISFSFAPSLATHGINSSAFIGDVDGDGWNDIVSTCPGPDSTFSVFKNNGNGGEFSFSPRVDYSIRGFPGYVTFGDIDGDSKQDIVITNGYYNHSGWASLVTESITIVRNLSTPGNLSLASPINIATSFSPWNVALCDVNGDNKLDLVSGNYDNLVSILRNSCSPGVISFGPRIDYTAGNNPLGVAVGDLDGDGKPEIAVVNNGSLTMSVYVNQNPSDVFLCPNGNTVLHSNVTGTNYLWYVDAGMGFTPIVNNSTYTGATTISLQLNNIPDLWYGYKYRCIANGLISKSFTVKFANQWISTTSSSWEDPLNWSCSSVPTSNTDVIISSGSVDINSNVTIRSLTTGAGAVITVNAGYLLTITR